MKYIKCLGLECPQPVIKTKKYLEENPETLIISVSVDNKAAAENVSKFLSYQGFLTKITQDDNEFLITGEKNNQAEKPAKEKSIDNKRSTLIIFARNTIGTEKSELGAKLMLNFIKTLPEMKDSLWRLIFLNEGVKLTTKGSEALATLQSLEQDGISILVCGTCLEHYKILEEKLTGETTNMLDIITSLQVAEKVINI